jgi:two-component system nitrogen regulation response regulator GlnG
MKTQNKTTEDTEIPDMAGKIRPGWQESTIVCLGIIWHPNPQMIGMTAPLSFHDGNVFRISRREPSFSSGNRQEYFNLDDRHISRQPIVVQRVTPRSYTITAPDSHMSVSVNGRPVVQSVTVSLDELGEDILICLADTIILSIFETLLPLHTGAAKHGLIGISKGMQRVWALVRQAAPTSLPVLLTGATGTGKELVASAIHALSTRSAQKLHIVNMASLSPSVGLAELFGATAGAYTGATSARTGLFALADGATLFMDEVGDTPDEMQPMLLRALESGEYRRLGDNKNQIADVRVISATDRSLEEGNFNQPLRHRLQGVVIRLAPLRERRVDIGLLLRHFLTRQEARLDIRDPGTLPAHQVMPLLLHSWPGNIRELMGVARQLRLGVPVTLASTPIPSPATDAGRAPVANAPMPVVARKHRDPTTVADAELVGALEATDWNIKAAAAVLNVSRTSLYRLIERSPTIRMAGDGPHGHAKDIMHHDAGSAGTWPPRMNFPKDSLRRQSRRGGMQ